MILSKPQIVNFVKASLGYPVVNIEIADSEIEKFVDIALMTKEPYYYGTSLIQKTYPGYGYPVDLSMDSVHAVVHVYETQATWTLFGGAFDNLIEVRQNLKDFSFIDYAVFSYRRAEFQALIDKNFRYNEANGKLYLDDYYSGAVAVECIKDIKDVSEISDPEAISWILKHTLAQTMVAVGLVRRKFNVQSGPYTMDGSDLVSEGQAQKQALEEQLKSSDSGFFFVLRS